MLKRYTYIVYVMMRARSETKEGMIKLIVNNLLRIQNERKIIFINKSLMMQFYINQIGHIIQRIEK